MSFARIVAFATLLSRFNRRLLFSFVCGINGKYKLPHTLIRVWEKSPYFCLDTGQIYRELEEGMEATCQYVTTDMLLEWFKQARLEWLDEGWRSPYTERPPRPSDP